MLPTFNSFGDIVLYEHFSTYTNSIKQGGCCRLLMPAVLEAPSPAPGHLEALTHNFSLYAGDIVIVRSPQNPRHLVCKRVHGLQGDNIRIPSSYLGPSKTVEVRPCFAPCGGASRIQWHQAASCCFQSGLFQKAQMPVFMEDMCLEYCRCRSVISGFREIMRLIRLIQGIMVLCPLRL